MVTFEVTILVISVPWKLGPYFLLKYFLPAGLIVLHDSSGCTMLHGANKL